MELGKPVFEEIGEEFLRSKVPNYTKSGLGIALTKVMLNGISGDRIDKIYQGVEDALEGREYVSEETKAAIFATEIYDGTNKYKDPNEFSEEHVCALYSVYEGTRANKTVCTPHPEDLEAFKRKVSEKEIMHRNPIRRDELEVGYKYYTSNFNEIPESFRDPLKDYDQQAIVAYYVA